MLVLPLPSSPPPCRCWLPTPYHRKNMPRSAQKSQLWTSVTSLQRPSGEYIMENPCHSSSRMYQWKIKKRNCQSPSTLLSIHIFPYSAAHTHTSSKVSMNLFSLYHVQDSLTILYYLLSQLLYTTNGHEIYIPTSTSVYHQ